MSWTESSRGSSPVFDDDVDAITSTIASVGLAAAPGDATPAVGGDSTAEEVPDRLLRKLLSPFDQTSPRLYVHKFFCYAMEEPMDKSATCTHLEKLVVNHLMQRPSLAGWVGPSPHAIGDKIMELAYPEEVTAELAASRFTAKDLHHVEFPLHFDEAAAKGMPPSMFDPARFSSVPEWPEPGQILPALAVQANFCRGGLILCFALHHVVADGGTFTDFIKQLEVAASEIDLPDKDKTKLEDGNRIDYECIRKDNITPLKSFHEFDNTGVPFRLVNCSFPATTRILVFSAPMVKKLEQAVAGYLKKIYGEDAWASNIACLSSLIWVAAMRARKGRLLPTEIAKIGVAVNVRAILDLPKEYFGNAMVHTKATRPVSEIVADHPDSTFEGIASSIPLKTVAEGAYLMRQAVRGVDHRYVTARAETFASLMDPREVCVAYDTAMDNRYTGIDFSSWRDQGADINFRIPGTKNPTCDFWRKAFSPNEGAYNILPRKGGSKGDARWEVSLGLSIVDMDRACADTELGAWMERVLE